MSAGALSQKPGSSTTGDVKPAAEDPALAKSRSLSESVGPARFNGVKRERAAAGAQLKSAIQREAIHRKEKPGEEKLDEEKADKGKPGKGKPDKGKTAHGPAEKPAMGGAAAAGLDKGAPKIAAPPMAVAKPPAPLAAGKPPAVGKPG